MKVDERESRLATSGNPELDEVLGGGFERERLFLIEGIPGSGKTTLALQFLMGAAERGETVLYFTLSETAAELKSAASSHGWDLAGIQICELVASEKDLALDARSSMYHPSETELAETTQFLLTEVERLNPSCLVLDSLSELRLLSGSSLRYRRQILALKQYFAARGVTVLLLDDKTAENYDLQVHSIAHGVVLLEQLSPEYGAERRRLRVLKYRGRAYRGGFHDFAIRRGGLAVFPRLIAAEHRLETRRSQQASGIAQLDSLLGGGVEFGSSTLFVGAAGTGKSTLSAKFAAAAAAAGRGVLMLIFDESESTLRTRAASLGIDLESGLESGKITIKPVDPAELSPGELTQTIRIAVETNDVTLVIIDSLNGYLNAMPEERYLSVQLHELLAYLGHRSVATILVSAHQGLVGPHFHSPVDASYLADAILLLRYFEHRGELRQALSVLKKRGGWHERTIRELRLDQGRIWIGDVLREYRGVLTGVPTLDQKGEVPVPPGSA